MLENIPKLKTLKQMYTHLTRMTLDEKAKSTELKVRFVIASTHPQLLKRFPLCNFMYGCYSSILSISNLADFLRIFNFLWLVIIYNHYMKELNSYLLKYEDMCLSLHEKAAILFFFIVSYISLQNILKGLSI